MILEKLKILIPYLLIIVLPIFAFRPAIFNGKIITAGDFSGSDLLDLHLPYKYFLHEAYTSGKFPLWTTHLANGFPFAAEGQSGPFYPPNIALSFLEPYMALNWSIVLAFVIAGCGSYAYCRALKLTQLPALWVALVFMFSSFFVARVKHLNMIAAAAYLPWNLWTIRMLFERRNKNWAVALGVTWSLQFLAGHPQMAYYCVIMSLWQIGVETLYLILHERRVILKNLKYVFLYALIAATVGFVLSAVQTFPTLELTKLSTRSQGSFEGSVANPLTPKFLITFVSPYFWGNPAEGNYKLSIWHSGVWWENVMYIGLIPFVLLFYFVLFRGWKYLKRNRTDGKMVNALGNLLISMSFREYYVFSLLIGGLVFFSLAFGGYSISYLFAYYIIPGMSYFRFPNMFNLYTVFSFSVVSGFGFSSIINKTLFRIFKIREIFIFCLFIFTFIDLYCFTYKYISFYSASKYLNTPVFKKLFNENTDLYRTYSQTQYALNPYYSLGWKKGEKAIISLQESLPGNAGLMSGIDSYSDRGWSEGGLTTKERFFLEYSFVFKELVNSDNWNKILGAWNVRYVMTFDELKKYKLRDEINLDPYFKKTLKLYENPELIPRAFISYSVKYVPTKEDLLENMKHASWNPYNEVYTLEKSAESTYSADNGKAAGSVEFLKYTNDLVIMKASAKNNGELVFSDTHYPGWHAYVDEKEVPISAINLTQRGVRILKGDHIIKWIYRPTMFYLGLAITLISVILIVTGIIFNGIRKSRSYEI